MGWMVAVPDSGGLSTMTRSSTVAAIALALSTPAAAQTYEVITIEGPFGLPTSPLDINNRGEVVGEYLDDNGLYRAFLWSHGTLTDLGTLTGTESVASAINNNSIVVGEFYTGTLFADRHPFFWRNGMMIELATFNGAGGIAFGINDLDQIIGVSGPDITRWDDGVPVDLSDNPPGFGPLGSYGSSINSSGVIAGGAVDGFPFFNWTPARWINGIGEHIAPASTHPHEKYSINEAGFIVGRHPGFLSSARWLPTGGALYLGIDRARDINNTGQVVGTHRGRAMYWEDLTVTDLNDLLPPGAPWLLQSAEAINDLGQIVGEGLFNGVTRGFLLTRLRLELIDPTTNLVEAPVSLINPEAYGTGGRVVVGVGADGVTRLLLRVRGLPGPGTLTYQITDEFGGTSGVGRLRSAGGKEDVSTLTVPTVTLATGQSIGAAVLVAPDDFVRTTTDVTAFTRPINIAVEYIPDSGGQVLATSGQVIVRRPPVLLLHGIWSHGDKWEWDTLQKDDHLEDRQDTDEIDDRGYFLVHAEDYQSSNDEPFSTNVRAARAGVERARRLMRNIGFASTQVDVAAHSMGGLLIRLYISEHFQPGGYRRADNYFQGDVNRLITLATPHQGSPIASITSEVVDGVPEVVRSWLLNFLREKFGCIDCGAMADLQPDSPVITSMDAAQVPVHAFIAVGGDEAVQEVTEPLGWAALIANWARTTLIAIDAVYPAGSEHDLMVFADSGKGGLDRGHVTVLDVDFPPGSGKTAVHTAIVNNNNYAGMVRDLLNVPVSDSDTFAPEFPANNPPPSAISGGSGIPVYGELVSGITITSPLPGATFEPGQSIQVTLEPLDGFEPARVMVASERHSEFLDTLPLTADLLVPADSFGPLTISAFSFDAGWNIAIADDVTVEIVPAADLISIEQSPGLVTLLSYAPEYQLRTFGRFDDGQVRELTGAAGISYVSLDPNVVSVNIEGRVTAEDLGSTTVTVTFDGLTATAIVSVPTFACAGDMNADGRIGVTDFLWLLRVWGPCPEGAGDCSMDLDGDGEVGLIDFHLLIERWGLCQGRVSPPLAGRRPLASNAPRRPAIAGGRRSLP